MSSGGFRSCVCIPRAELAARRDVEHDTNRAIAYEPLLATGVYLYLSVCLLFSFFYHYQIAPTYPRRTNLFCFFERGQS